MEVKIMLNVPKTPKNQKTKIFLIKKKPKNFFERFSKKVNIIAVKTQNF